MNSLCVYDYSCVCAHEVQFSVCLRVYVKLGSV